MKKTCGRIWVALVGLAMLGGCAGGRPPVVATEQVKLQAGDLLFQDLDGSALSDAIEAVTEGYDHTRLSHVAMVVSAEGEPQVIEAVGAGVKVTALGKFLARSHDDQGHPKVMVGRLRPEYRELIPGAVEYARLQTGKPYDKSFLLTEQSFYCSELIYFAFRSANHGKPVFTTAPMTFKDPRTHEFFPAWVDYYRELGMAIPEGQPGLNPGGMSREKCVEIVCFLGQPGRK